MESPSAALGLVPCSAASSNEENPRLKLLCSFSGSIMPRPKDGKLRYVGGETRIVCLPQDIKYGELMARMRELYEGATLLKYQQPDEDLDALVSVVNDDDVINMMEEYDKLGSGDGFTRLRIFLFSHPEQESSPHFIDADERDSERRYVDALNSLNDASDFRMQLQSESPPAMNLIGDAHMAEQFYNQVGLEGSVFNQRNFEMLVPQHNLRQLTIPRMGSGQLMPSISQRYNEVEAQWSPAFYSPRHHGLHDPRPLTETPSSARLHIPFGESDSLAEEYSRQQVHQPSQYDCSPRFPESVVRLQSGAISGDVSGFPGNLYHGPNVFERNRICENCQITFQRCQAYSDSHWKNGEQSLMEQSGVGSGAPLAGGPCAACTPNRETYLFNKDPNFHHGIYPKEQTDPRAFFNEPQSVERGWIHRHHLNVWAEDKSYIAGAGRLGDHYSVDRAGMNFSLGHGNLTDDHYMTSNSVHEDPRYIQAAHELGKEACHDQFVASRPHIPFNERGAQHGNFPYEYGIDNSYKGSHGHVSAQALLRNVQNPRHGAPYEASNPVQQANGIGNPGFMKGAAESSPRFCHARENKNTLIESSSIALGLDSSGIPEYFGDHKVNSQHFEEDKRDSEPDLINIFIPAEPTSYVNPSTLTGDISLTLSIPDHHLESKSEANAAEAARRGQNIYPREEKAAVIREQKINQGEGKFIKNLGGFKGVHSPSSHPLIVDGKADDLSGDVNPLSVNLNNLERPGKCHDFVKAGRGDQSALAEDSNASDIKPGPLDSENKAVVGAFKEVKPRGQEHLDDDHLVVQPATEETALKELEANNVNHEHELDSENDYQNMSAIEPTKAEEEAIARGLQTIKNDDLEEIRELGTGTYGAVYHGKWKGTDVAIKKIKASCFAGRPSERERLIADFWKEAQILSSLHHPNVVSFYGVVRDGPDGSLVTVTEFMVNGSLKQFLKKKDRTIDRRKRLIIAMDVAFGMEYLHGKNIVHFDLKCENLLVNMRDPHRPVCKIGDLGLSKVKQHTLVSGGVRGTLPWMAPELLTGKNNMVTDKIDVYSFGIVMWELLTGQEPYADMHCASIIGGIVNNQIRPEIPAWCDPEWKALMESCWASDPATRPSFLEISQKLRTMAAAMNVK